MFKVIRELSPMAKVTSTDAGLIAVAIVLVVVIVLGVLFYMGALSNTSKVNQQLGLVSATTLVQAQAIAGIASQQDSLKADTMSLQAATQAAVQDLQQNQRRTVLVNGNNGTVSCPTFCNNTTYYNLNDRFPSMQSWRGSTALSVYTLGVGLCECIEDPRFPVDTLPRDGSFNRRQVYGTQDLVPVVGQPQVGVDYPFSDIKTLTSTTPAQCAVACGEQDGCKGFVTNTEGTTCWLKSSMTTAPAQNPERVAYTYSEVLPGSVPGPTPAPGGV